MGDRCDSDTVVPFISDNFSIAPVRDRNSTPVSVQLEEERMDTKAGILRLSEFHAWRAGVENRQRRTVHALLAGTSRSRGVALSASYAPAQVACARLCTEQGRILCVPYKTNHPDGLKGTAGITATTTGTAERAGRNLADNFAVYRLLRPRTCHHPASLGIT